MAILAYLAISWLEKWEHDFVELGDVVKKIIQLLTSVLGIYENQKRTYVTGIGLISIFLPTDHEWFNNSPWNYIIDNI